MRKEQRRSITWPWRFSKKWFPFYAFVGFVALSKLPFLPPRLSGVADANSWYHRSLKILAAMRPYETQVELQSWPKPRPKGRRRSNRDEEYRPIPGLTFWGGSRSLLGLLVGRIWTRIEKWGKRFNFGILSRICLRCRIEDKWGAWGAQDLGNAEENKAFLLGGGIRNRGRKWICRRNKAIRFDESGERGISEGIICIPKEKTGFFSKSKQYLSQWSSYCTILFWGFFPLIARASKLFANENVCWVPKFEYLTAKSQWPFRLRGKQIKLHSYLKGLNNWRGKKKEETIDMLI